MREPEVEERVRRFLVEQGYEVVARSAPSGPGIIATKNGKTLVVEVKGDRPGHKSSPGTIYVDVVTLVGQIVLRQGRGQGDEYAVAIRPVHKKLIDQTAPALNKLLIQVFLVDDSNVRVCS